MVRLVLESSENQELNLAGGARHLTPNPRACGTNAFGTCSSSALGLRLLLKQAKVLARFSLSAMHACNAPCLNQAGIQGQAGRKVEDSWGEKDILASGISGMITT